MNASASKHRPKPKIAILFGIFSGIYATRQLHSALQNAGYSIVKDTAQADIILAHSGGCLWVPKTPTEQLLVLIDPPYWPGKTIRERARARGRSNFQFLGRGIPMQRWLQRNLWALYYIVAEPRRARYIIRAAATYDLERAVQGRRVVLVRNELDDWLTPDLAELERANPQLTVVRLPGDHDDFHYHPERYVHLLQSLE